MEPAWKSADETLSLYKGDCREVLAQMPADLFTACITDPPYELGFMGKDWDKSGVAFNPATWEAVMRTMKPGAHLLAFGGTRTYHRICCAIEDAGFEIRDCIMWIYGSGFPKSLDVSKAIDKAAGAEREVVGIKPGHEEFANRGNLSSVQSFKGTFGSEGGFARPWMDDPEKVEKYHQLTAPATDAAKLWSGYGTALKPAYEPIIVARKPLRGTVAANCLEHGCGAINVDGCRVGTEPGELTPRNNKPGPNGWKNSSGGYVEPSPLGRWPANVIHDGSEEVLAGFPNAAPQCGSQKLSQGRGGVFNGGAPGTIYRDATDSAARFFYCAKASKSDRGKGNTHATVKPLALMEYLVKLVAMPSGNRILDPFSGSGTTLLACYNQFIEATGIDLEAGHVDIAGGRAAVEEEKTPLLRPKRDTQRSLL